MSLQTPEPNSANGTNQAESLKVWSCVNCRRRKVRCDRRHPCAPCIRNKTECVFPISGRTPRRGRDANYPNPPAQKQAELLRRLRRLEAMVGDLGSQVEHAAVVRQTSPPVEGSTSATSANSSEMGWPDHGLALRSPSASGSPQTARDGMHIGSSMARGSSESPQVSDEFGELVVASNGDLLVGNRFWTVFCKEVCSSSAPLCFALPTGVELGICNWRSNVHFSLTCIQGGGHLRSRPRDGIYPLRWRQQLINIVNVRYSTSQQLLQLSP